MVALLEVHSLTIRFADAEPVRGRNFTVSEGETLAIVGESGSGKSLTALALMRLLPGGARVAEGSIRFGGRELLALSEKDMRQMRGRDIGMIFQEPMTSLNPVVTIGAQVCEVLRLHEGMPARAARARAIELLDLVRIPDPRRRIKDYPHQLSGGMRQRVMIAMAVACSPKLLVADEPTTALDVTIQAQVLDLIDHLRRQLSMAVILITHDLGIVGQWADNVVVMYAGRKVEEAPPELLLAAPLHPYTSGLLAASPQLNAGQHYRQGPLREIPGSILSAAAEVGCPFRPRCPAARVSCAQTVPSLANVGRRLVACPFTPSVTKAHHVTALGC
jgi:peptide/nickel transport system ATP-binding protein